MIRSLPPSPSVVPEGPDGAEWRRRADPPSSQSAARLQENPEAVSLRRSLSSLLPELPRRQALARPAVCRPEPAALWRCGGRDGGGRGHPQPPRHRQAHPEQPGRRLPLHDVGRAQVLHRLRPFLPEVGLTNSRIPGSTCCLLHIC